MFRIDGAGHVNNRFTEGNPVEGQRATVLTADWLNALQEEVLTVLQQAGIVPDKTANNQLYLAIVQIVAGSLGEEGEEGSVPTTRQINTGGLATGGGALANDLTISVAAANGSETASGSSTTKAVTPAALAAAAGSVKATNGYFRLPDGWIIQFGQATAGANSTTIITLPTTFPTACAFAGVEGGAAAGDAEENNPFVSGRGTGSLSIYSSRDSTTQINWLALGY